MTDAPIASAAPAAAPEVKTNTAPQAETKVTPTQTASFDDFDENLIPEGSRDNFRKYREAQQAKSKDYETRLSNSTRERLEFEARAKAYEQRLQPPVDDKEIGPEPDYKEFKTIEEYRDALKAWGKKAAVAEYRNSQTQQTAAQKQQETAAKRAAKGQQAMAKYPDFRQLLQPLIPIVDSIPVLSAFIDESDAGTDVLYQLLKNPVTLEALSKMTPFAAGKELLRIEAALSAPAAKAISQAPEPMNPVNTGGDGSVRSILEMVKKDDVTDFVNRENRKKIRGMKGE